MFLLGKVPFRLFLSVLAVDLGLIILCVCLMLVFYFIRLVLIPFQAYLCPLSPYTRC